ncbi:MAG TPA: prenyltransferase/squalene oxidase repeat-containing protein [Pirellulales bacterium]|nr:prenyltransferase/squalene oxidase repeat-containing protein [Pirellulales bacterium]
MTAIPPLRRRVAFVLYFSVTMLVVARPAMAADDAAASRAKAYEAAVQKGVEYLRSKGQADDGSFSAAAGPGITAIVATAVMANGRTADDPLVAKSLKYLEGYVQPDGGIYAPKSRLRNYETCLGVMCFAAANRDGRYDKTLKNADAFLKGLQFGDKDDRTPSDIAYGGVGYGGSERPDLSNTHFLMEALEAAGDGADDEAVKRALVFVSRCQNLESANNTTQFAAKVQDGGFYYTPIGEGSSPAGKTANGGLRSYGSMSYAGLKSMIFAGLEPDDPRVRAAVKWAQDHYSVTENPGLGDEGLYYYYHLFGKALQALGQEKLVDAQGLAHDWREDLVMELARRQRDDGSWTNSNTRWLEGDPNLVTGYALLTLSYCKP